MTTDRPSQDIKTLWNEQQTDGFAMSVADIRARSDKFQKQIRRRNWREYIATVLVIAIFGWYVVVLPGLVTKLGSLLTIVGALFVAWQLHRRASSVTPPESGSVLEVLAFHRRELERQRVALHAILIWYQAPLMPGLALVVIGLALQAPVAAVGLAAAGAAAVICTLVFGFVWWINRRGAAQLQRQIDALDRLNVG